MSDPVLAEPVVLLRARIAAMSEELQDLKLGIFSKELHPNGADGKSVEYWEGYCDALKRELGVLQTLAAVLQFTNP